MCPFSVEINSSFSVSLVGMGGVGAAAVGTAPPALGLVSSLDSPDPRTLSSVQHSLTSKKPR